MDRVVAPGKEIILDKRSVRVCEINAMRVTVCTAATLEPHIPDDKLIGRFVGSSDTSNYRKVAGRLEDRGKRSLTANTQPMSTGQIDALADDIYSPS